MVRTAEPTGVDNLAVAATGGSGCRWWRPLEAVGGAAKLAGEQDDLLHVTDQMGGRIVDRAEAGCREALDVDRLGEAIGRTGGEGGIGFGHRFGEMSPEQVARYGLARREFPRAIAEVGGAGERRDDPLPDVSGKVEELRLDTVGAERIGPGRRNARTERISRLQAMPRPGTSV